MKSIAAVIVAIAVLAGTAAAQPASPASSAPPPAEEPPYESTALLWSLGGSVAAWSTIFIAANEGHGNNAAVPLGMLASLFAPSFGHWYAGDGFSRGFRTRLIGAGLMVAAAVPMLSCEDECHPTAVLQGALYGGLALYLFGTFDDIITAAGAARAAQPHRIVAAPMIQRGGSGLVITAQF